jgi:transcriptional regulator with XRE-family HTH domain
MLAQKVRDLNSAGGLTEQQIADRLGVSQGTVNRIKLGKQKPGYELGRRIDELWAELCECAAQQGGPNGL